MRISDWSSDVCSSDLGVSENVCFINAFVETGTLLDYLAAADVYVTPYLNEAQITSGTLSYAMGVGKPVISTPYWHAAELLADDHGRSEEHTSELQSLMRISYAVFCLKKKK